MSIINLMMVIPSLRLAGAERQLVELINGLDPHVYKISLVTFENDLELLGEVKPALAAHYRLPKHRRFDLGLARDLATIIDTDRPDIIHSTLNFASLITWVALKHCAHRPAFIPAIHATFPRNRKEALLQRLVYSPVLRRSDVAVAVSEQQRQYLVDHYGFKVSHLRVIQNGININRMVRTTDAEEKRQSLGLGHTDKVIGILAGLRPEKGHEYLFQAVAQLVNRGHTDLRVLAVGDGPCRDALEAYVDQLAIREYVKFLGFRKDVSELIACFDVAVLASYAVETLSMAILECMAVRKPAVVTDVGGMREIVLDGLTGYVVPPRDVSKLAARIESVLYEPGLAERLGQNGYGLFRESFTSEAMTGKWDALYREQFRRRPTGDVD